MIYGSMKTQRAAKLKESLKLDATECTHTVNAQITVIDTTIVNMQLTPLIPQVPVRSMMSKNDKAGNRQKHKNEIVGN